jgi:hypothetical protein
MPRKPASTHFYSVYLTFYATPEVKERVERGEEYITSPGQLTSETFYFGSNERQAGVKFYQAAKRAMQAPLALSVTVIRDLEVIVRVKPDRG